MSFELKVEGFVDGGVMPDQFTCEGANRSPELEWHGAPGETRSYALVVDDPDAPAGTWNHWLLWNIPAGTHRLEANYHPAKPVTAGRNDFGKAAYGGPCPPKGHGTHRYHFRLFAVDVETLPLAAGASRTELDAALVRHALGTAEYLGRFSR